MTNGSRLNRPLSDFEAEAAARRGPWFDPLDLHCQLCGTNWQDWQPRNVRLQLWIAFARAVACPQCGAGWDRVSPAPQPPEIAQTPCGPPPGPGTGR